MILFDYIDNWTKFFSVIFFSFYLLQTICFHLYFSGLVDCNTLYHRCYIRLRQLARQSRREDLIEPVGRLLANITANRLIFQYALDQVRFLIVVLIKKFLFFIYLDISQFNCFVHVLFRLNKNFLVFIYSQDRSYLFLRLI